MKNIIGINFCLLFLCSFSYAQQQHKGIITYKSTIDDKATLMPRILDYKLYFINNKSLELVEEKGIESTKVSSGVNETTQTINLNQPKKNFVYKDFDNNELRLADNISLKQYLIADTLANFKWTITNEYQKILKYKCTKATTTFRGRNYIAWFTDEIALQSGPWKFCGLPGLIVKVADVDNIYSYEMTGIELDVSFDESLIAIPRAFVNDKSINHDSFIEFYNKKIKALEAQSNASTYINGNMSGSRKLTIPPKMEKF